MIDPGEDLMYFAAVEVHFGVVQDKSRVELTHLTAKMH
jgi:hypothetical protein